MKKLRLLILFSLVAFFCNAQLIQPAKPTETFSKTFSIIVLDYKNNFINIQQKELAGSVGNNIFNSSICLPGASHCTITRYNSLQDKSASWQATLFAGESYEEALKAYKNIFSQVKHSSIMGIDKKAAGFEGEMEKPDENIRFTVSALRLNAADSQYKNFTADIELTNNMEGWEVHLNLYRKKADTEGNSIE